MFANNSLTVTATSYQDYTGSQAYNVMKQEYNLNEIFLLLFTIIYD